MKQSISLKTLLQSPIILKSSALIIGVSLWSIISASYETTIEIKAPVCFYNNNPELQINAPEEITLCVKGRRSLLKKLITEPPVVLINSQKLKKELTHVILSSEELYLPPDIKLVHYHPSPLIVYQQFQTLQTA